MVVDSGGGVLDLDRTGMVMGCDRGGGGGGRTVMVGEGGGGTGV